MLRETILANAKERRCCLFDYSNALFSRFLPIFAPVMVFLQAKQRKNELCLGRQKFVLSWLPLLGSVFDPTFDKVGSSSTNSSPILPISRLSGTSLYLAQRALGVFVQRQPDLNFISKFVFLSKCSRLPET